MEIQQLFTTTPGMKNILLLLNKVFTCFNHHVINIQHESCTNNIKCDRHMNYVLTYRNIILGLRKKLYY